jgi:hypothetical protein
MDAPTPRPSAEPSGTPVVEPTAPSAVRDAWRDLPPLRPSSPAIELTAPVQRLAATMTSTQHPGVTQDELGHSRAADGPAGTVAGLLKPRAATHRERTESDALIYATTAPEPVAGASAVPLRRTQRPVVATAEHPRQAAGPPSGAPAAPVEPKEPHAPPAPSPAVRVPVDPPSWAAPAVPVAGAQLMPASTELPTVAVRPLRARERAASAVPPREPTPLPVAVPDASQPIQVRDAATAPMAAATSPPPASPRDPAPESSPAPEPPGSAVRPAVERSPLVGSTRIVRRIGEPLRERPAGMVATAAWATRDAAQPPLAVPASIARLAEVGPVPPRPSLPEPGVVPARSPRAVASVDVPSTGHGHGADTAAAPLPTRPLVGSRPSIQRLADGPARATGLATGPTRAAPDGDEPVPVRWDPIAEHRAQRAPEGVPADLRDELEPVLGTSLSDVKVHRDAETGEAARHLSAKAFTAGGEVFLPDWHGSTSGGEARTILAHELTHVAQQRRLGPSLPDEESASGATLESEARAVAGQGPVVPTRPVASSESTPGPQRFPGERPSQPVRALPHRSHGSSPGSAMSPMEVVARVQAAAAEAGIATVPPTAAAPHHSGSTLSSAIASAGPSGSLAPGTVQRLDEADASPEPTTTSSSVVAPTPDSTDDPAQLDELARRLYPRFRTRLRQELLADRERSGRLFDVR